MNPSARPPLHVVAGAYLHPRTVLDNETLEGSVPGLKPGWIAASLGIEERRVLGPQEHVGDLAREALSQALAQAGWTGGELGAVLCATSFADDILPATASFVARDAAPHAVAFDVNAACASVPYALTVARSLMADLGIERVAVCAAERPSAWADYEDPESCVYWGDSAGVLLLQRERPDEGFAVRAVSLANDNVHPEKVRVRHRGTFHHDGRYSYQQVCSLTQTVVSSVLSETSVAAEDLTAFVGHQSNIRLLQEVGSALRVPWSRQWHNVEWAGNQGGAGVLTAFVDGWHRNRDGLTAGDVVVLAAVGGGYSAGAVMLEWVGD